MLSLLLKLESFNLMEISDIQNVQHNVWVSQKFLNEIENVATKSTSGNRGTSAVVEQLGDFIMYVIRFLQNLGNFAHSSPYIAYGGGLYGYLTDADDPRHGVGIISFRYLPNDIVYVEGISINLSNYSLLIENKIENTNRIVHLSESNLRHIIRESLIRTLYS